MDKSELMVSRRKLLGTPIFLAGITGCSAISGKTDTTPTSETTSSPTETATATATSTVPTPYRQEAYVGSFTSSGRWPMVGHDGARTGWQSESVAPRADVGVAWLQRVPGDEYVNAHPVVGPERVYTPTYVNAPSESNQNEAALVGFDAKSGRKRMEVRVGAGRINSLSIMENRLLAVRGIGYEGPTESKLIGLSRSEGDVRWRITVPRVIGTPTIVEGTCFLVTGDPWSNEAGEADAAYAYRTDGTQKWHTPIDGNCVASPCATEETVFVPVGDGRIVALDSETGAKRWEERIVTKGTEDLQIAEAPVVAGDQLYVPGSDERLTAVNATTGEVRWRKRIYESDHGNAIATPAVTSDAVYVYTFHGGLLSLDPADGAINWRVDRYSGRNQPVVTDDTILVSEDGGIHAVDPDGDHLWTVKVPCQDPGRFIGFHCTSAISLAHRTCYSLAPDNRLYAIRDPS